MVSDRIERWWATTPEPRLELIDGRLIVSTIAGTRRLTWQLLDHYGPAFALPHAPRELWWTALRQAFEPRPMPDTAPAWAEWADAVEHDPEPPPAGPLGSAEHRRMHQLLRFGLFALDNAGLARSLGRDFVVRLGDDGLTPDLLVVGRARLADLRGYYLDSPPDVAIEIALDGADEDLLARGRLYERGRVPEYWTVDPERRRASFWRLGNDGRYHEAFPDDDQVYRSVAVPRLALSLPHLWSMEDTDWQQPWLPFLPVSGDEPLPRPRDRQPDELGWDAIPFAPRVDLEPVAIRFEEYISWSPEAKFEVLDGQMVIGGDEGTSRVMAMLLMTLGLREAIKLAHPRDWVRCLT